MNGNPFVDFFSGKLAIKNRLEAWFLHKIDFNKCFILFFAEFANDVSFSNLARAFN